MNARVVDTYNTVMIKKWFHPSQERQSAVYNWAYIIDVFLPYRMAIKSDIKQFSMLNLFNLLPINHNIKGMIIQTMKFLLRRN